MLTYTRCGNALLMVNPHRPMEIYGEDFVNRYNSEVSALPHIFTVARQAWESAQPIETFYVLFNMVDVTSVGLFYNIGTYPGKLINYG